MSLHGWQIYGIAAVVLLGLGVGTYRFRSTIRQSLAAQLRRLRDMHLRGWQFAVILALLLFAAFFGPAYIYWHGIQAHYARCVYGDPVCSLTVSTYLLVALTGGAFIAAYRAADYAKRALEHEQSAEIALNACAKKSAKRHAGHTIELWLCDLSTGFEPKEPAGHTWVPNDFDCHSIGKSAVVNGKLWIKIDGQPPHKYSAAIGNIRSGKWVHVRLQFATALLEHAAQWEGATHKNDEQITLFPGDVEPIKKPDVRTPQTTPQFTKVSPKDVAPPRIQ